MAAPDFYFGVNAIFRHIHERYGRARLEEYWQQLALEFYGSRIHRWRQGGLDEIARDWQEYFSREPGAKVNVSRGPAGEVVLDIAVCPAIKHLRDNRRDIVPYFCEHCDHTCGAMARAVGFNFERTGGMGSCRQTFSPGQGDGGQG